MTYKFTPSAEKAMEFANEITLKLGHDYIGTEHVLYGLSKENTGVASKVLEGQGINYENILVQIEELIGVGKLKSKKVLGFTPRTKTTLENAYQEAKKMNSECIGTEHLLIRNAQGRR